MRDIQQKETKLETSANETWRQLKNVILINLCTDRLQHDICHVINLQRKIKNIQWEEEKVFPQKKGKSSKVTNERLIPAHEPSQPLPFSFFLSFLPSFFPSFISPTCSCNTQREREKKKQKKRGKKRRPTCLIQVYSGVDGSGRTRMYPGHASAYFLMPSRN